MTAEAREELRAGAIGPEALAVMTTAYEQACEQLGAKADEITKLRIAHGIVAYARAGTMDPETLTTLVVRLITGEERQ
jgi:hypothetical protein